MLNRSIWPIDRTLSSATTPGQSGPKSDGNKVVLCIHQSSSITTASPSDCLVSHPGHSLGKSYFSTEMQSLFSAVPTDWASLASKLMTMHKVSYSTDDIDGMNPEKKD